MLLGEWCAGSDLGPLASGGCTVAGCLLGRGLGLRDKLWRGGGLGEEMGRASSYLLLRGVPHAGGGDRRESGGHRSLVGCYREKEHSVILQQELAIRQ